MAALLKNAVKEMMKEGKPALGMIARLGRSGDIARIAKTTGHDFVFVDGDHSEAGLLSDWNAWSGLVEPAGIVALHDSRSTPDRQIDDAGSVKVTRRVILQDARFQQIDAVDSLTVLRRR